MHTHDLNAQLAQLQQAADDQTQSYESSRDKLYQNIVDAYLWWQEASKDANYLSQLYKDAGIKTRTRGGNQPNFYPLIRLVWNIDITKRASTISDWAQSMLALHETATEDAKQFSDLRNDLINHIHDLGGLSELRGEKRMTEEELDAEERGEEVVSKRGRKPGTTNNDDIISSKTERAKSIPAKAKLAAFPSAITNSDDFVVMLARRNRQTNELEIVGSNYSDELVQDALLACTDIDRSSITPSLRLIAEALQPHAIPAKLEKYRKKFFDDSRYFSVTQADGTTSNVRESTTVLIDGKTNEIVVTKTPLTATCVSHVRPKTLKLYKGGTLLMRGSDRSWFERELIGNQKLALYTAEPENALVENSSDTHTRYSLHLTSANHKRSIYFYDAAEMPADATKGLTVPSKTDHDTNWTITATPQWLAEFDAACLSQWVANVKTHFNKPHNQQIGLSVDDNGLQLWWWWDKEKVDYLKSFAMPWSSNASVNITKDRPTAVHLKPKDAILLFSALPALPLASNDIVISATDAGVYVDYETDLANYSSYLPSFDIYEKVEQEKKARLKPKKAATAKGK